MLNLTGHDTDQKQFHGPLSLHSDKLQTKLQRSNHGSNTDITKLKRPYLL